MPEPRRRGCFRNTSFVFQPNEQCGTGVHHPHRVECPDPENCCGWESIGLLCGIDHQPWPCAAKRALEDRLIQAETSRLAEAVAAQRTKRP